MPDKPPPPLPKLCLIVARARNGVIGRDGDLPWRLRDDMAFFKRQTIGKPVIMGRKTWESFPKRPLPKRMNIILSRKSEYEAIGARLYSDVPAALSVANAHAQQSGVDEVFIIGGATLYEQTLPLIDRIYLTEIDAEIEGDAVFPALDKRNWQEAWSRLHAKDARNNHQFTIRCLNRVVGD